MKKICIIGIGNAWRGDDAVGLIVARKLEDCCAGVIIQEETGEGTALLEAWQGAEAVILIDAVQAGEAPGTILELDAGATPLPAKLFHASSHAFGVAEAVELARALGRLPASLIVFGIEGGRFEAGTGLSPEVESAVPEVVKRVRRRLKTLRSTGAD